MRLQPRFFRTRKNATEVACTSLTHRQALSHFGKLSPNRPVIYSRSNFRGHTADKIRLDRKAHAYRRSRKFTQLPRQFILLSGVQLKGGFHFRAHEPEPFIEKHLEGI